MTKKPSAATKAENSEIAADAVERPLESNLDNSAPTPAENIDFESQPAPQGQIEAVAPDTVALDTALAGELIADDGADGGDIEAQEVAGEPEAEAIEPVAPEAGIVAPGAGSAVVGTGESTGLETEGNQPETQQTLADPVADAADGNQPVPTAEQLGGLAQRIAEMLAWRRAELVAELSNDHGMTIERSIEGTRVSMAGITVSVAALGQAGEHQALDNWANAARRQVLELQAVPHG